MPESDRPLYYYGEPTSERWQQVRLAKASLNLGFNVAPTRATSPVGGIILAFSYPPFVNLDGLAYVASVNSQERFAGALRAIYLGETPERLTSAEKQLSIMLKTTIKEVTDEQE